MPTARYRHFVDAVIMGLGILALTPLLSLYTLDIHTIYPGHLVWGVFWCGWQSRRCFIC
jgi:hypothetical protein